MSNIFDVAALAGVSKTTVSKVLNNQYGVNENTRKKVLEAAKALNYIPNHAAKSLVTSKSGVIAVICNISFKISVYQELSDYLQSYASDLGYNLVFCSSNNDVKSKAKYINYFMGGAADGIIFFGSDKEDEAFIHNIKDCAFPLVVIENYFDKLKINNIIIDNINGSRSIVNHICSLGHRRIAYVTGNMEQRVAIDRFNGYMLALQENSIPFSPEYVIYTNAAGGSGKAAVSQLVTMKDKPTALCFFNDMIAYEAIWELNNLGYKIPQDFSVTGFDNFAGTFDFFRSSVKLTSSQQPMSEVSKAAVELLVENINSRDMDYRQLCFQTTLIEGNSCSSR